MKPQANDLHLRHRDDKSGSHLSNAVRHLGEHRTAEHHDVEQHADRMGDEHDRAGGGRDDASPAGIHEATSHEGGLEKGAGVKEAKGVASAAKIWDEGGAADQPHPKSRTHTPGV